jgi:hypothetical protein
MNYTPTTTDTLDMSEEQYLDYLDAREDALIACYARLGLFPPELTAKPAQLDDITPPF